MQVMSSYRAAEARIDELHKNNKLVHDHKNDGETRTIQLEVKVKEQEELIETLRKGSTEAARVAEWGSQAISYKLDQLALQRRIVGLQEHETYLSRMQAALEATIRQMEEESVKEEVVRDQKVRSMQAQIRDLERRLLEKEALDDATLKSNLEQYVSTEPPSSSLPLNERLESALRQLEECQKIISSQNASIITLNTNALALNAKIRTQEDLVLTKEAQLHELNVRMAKAAVVEASNIPSAITKPLENPPTTELRTLQNMYQLSCNTIEGLRDMLANKEESVLRYQQMIIEARETHRRDRIALEAEIRIFVKNSGIIINDFTKSVWLTGLPHMKAKAH